MAQQTPAPQTPFNIVVIGQAGRLEYEAVLFAASLRQASPGFQGRLFIAAPQPGDRWPTDPRITAPVRDLLEGFGAEILPFHNRHFGDYYPYGNKIEALTALPEGEPFVFFDTDTLVTGDLAAVPFPFARPSASMKREGTWPEIPLYGPGYSEIWRSLYDKFGIPGFEDTLDLTKPDEYWERYLYFNAGWFFGPCPRRFGETFVHYATGIRDDQPETLASQSLDPWLDQVALPLVIHALGGGRPGPELDGLDGDVTCHWRLLPLLYARESDRVVEMLEEVIAPNRIKKVLKEYPPIKRFVYQGRGRQARAMFDRDNLPKSEKVLRNRLKANKFWMR
jgi:hypothetical protein